MFAVQVAAGPQLRELAPFAELTLAALLVSTPHDGATLLRVYDDAQECSAQTLFAPSEVGRRSDGIERLEKALAPDPASDKVRKLLPAMQSAP